MDCRKHVFVLLSFVVIARYFVNTLEQYQRRLITDQQCNGNTAPSVSELVRSKLECMAQCQIDGQGTRACYDSADRMCSCCADNNSDNIVIETPAPIPAPSVQCYETPSSAVPVHGGSSFYVHPDVATFRECQYICSGLGGYVLMVENEDKSSAVQTFLDSNAGPVVFYWLAMISYTTDIDRPWYNIYNDDDVTFFNWGDNEPNVLDSEYCAAIMLTISCQWIDVVCDADITCVCEI